MHYGEHLFFVLKIVRIKIVDKALFEILACPICKGRLIMSHDKAKNDEPELHCRHCGVAYPIRDDIPVMLESEARTLTTDERLNESKP